MNTSWSYYLLNNYKVQFVTLILSLFCLFKISIMCINNKIRSKFLCYKKISFKMHYLNKNCFLKFNK